MTDADLARRAIDYLATASVANGQEAQAHFLRSGHLYMVASVPVTVALAAVGAAVIAAPECVWTHDRNMDSWDSACGQKWQFNDGGPAENNVRFCHGCGGRVAARYQESAHG